MGSGLAKHLGTKYDAAVKDVSVRMQAAKARTAVYALSQDDRRESQEMQHSGCNANSQRPKQYGRL